MKNKTLIERLLDAGYPAEEIYHWASDLYIFVTPLTTKVIDEWFSDFNSDGLKSLKTICGTFRDNVTGRMMYDVAFQYYKFN